LTKELNPFPLVGEGEQNRGVDNKFWNCYRASKSEDRASIYGERSRTIPASSPLNELRNLFPLPLREIEQSEIHKGGGIKKEVTMNITLDYLRGRRTWVVPNFVVWGDWSLYSFLLFYTETGANSKRIVFNKSTLGGLDQTVNFSSLYDFKGNQLPTTINHPKVIVLSKNEVSCLVVGQETDTGFRLAKLSESSQTGLVDLMIVEMA